MERVDMIQPEYARGAEVSLAIGKADLKARFIELRARGFSYLSIARELKVSKNTLCNWAKGLEAEISAAKAMELEALIEQHHLHRVGRIQRIGGITTKVLTELESRDLSSVPTEKLLDVLLRYHTEARDEVGCIRPPEAERDSIGPELTTEEASLALVRLMARYRAGEIDFAQAKEEAGLLSLLMRAIDQGELARKLEALEGVLDMRPKTWGHR
jgi:transcriptional regulator with XRE-family HTH domain